MDVYLLYWGALFKKEYCFAEYILGNYTSYATLLLILAYLSQHLYAAKIAHHKLCGTFGPWNFRAETEGDF